MVVLFRLVLGPIGYAVGFLIVNGYRLLFGWWLDPYTERKADERLASEIREKIPFLFVEHGARVVPTEGPLPTRGMDSAYATVESGNLRLRFITGRGDMTVRIAPKHSPADWHELSLVAMVIDTPQGIGPRDKVSWLQDVAKLLQTKWERLNKYLSPEQYPIIRHRLEEIYNLPGDDLWQAGILIPKHLRSASSIPLHLAGKH